MLFAEGLHTRREPERTHAFAPARALRVASADQEVEPRVLVGEPEHALERGEGGSVVGGLLENLAVELDGARTLARVVAQHRGELAAGLGRRLVGEILLGELHQTVFDSSFVS